MDHKKLGTYLLVVGGLLALLGGSQLYRADYAESHRAESFAKVRAQYPGAAIDPNDYEQMVAALFSIGSKVLGAGAILAIIGGGMRYSAKRAV